MPNGSMLVPPRSHAAEIMERPGAAEADVRCTLGHIRATNRLLGGRRALLRGLRPLLVDSPRDRSLTLLDVGTGSGDLPLEIIRMAGRLDRRIRITAIDRDWLATEIARGLTRQRRDVRVVRADAFAPPFPAKSFDVVTASMFLHHFPHEEVVRLLREFSRLARRAVLVQDLRRHRLPWLAMQLMARAARCNPMFVHDAPLSVLRGFTAQELRRAALESGSRRFDLRRCWPFRLLLTLRHGAQA